MKISGLATKQAKAMGFDPKHINSIIKIALNMEFSINDTWIDQHQRIKAAAYLNSLKLQHSDTTSFRVNQGVLYLFCERNLVAMYRIPSSLIPEKVRIRVKNGAR